MVDLLRATPESRGIPSEAIGRFINDVHDKNLELHSFMLQKDGAVVAEGWWKPYSPDVPHTLASLTKSFTATAVGFAVEEGVLCVEDYVISFFPDYDNPCKNFKKMKVKHLLTMNTGHTEDASRKTYHGSYDLVTNFLSIDVQKEPGTHFLYNSCAFYILSAIVQKQVGKNINDYLDEKLFKKIGIKYPKWRTCPNGIILGDGGLSVTTEDIMRFSMFMQNKGVWNGERLLSEKWIDDATSIHSDNGPNVWIDYGQGYGYSFWRCRNDAYMANGAYGQYGIVMNHQNATIAMTSGMEECQQLLDSVWDILLPAMGKEPLPENKKEHDKLKNLLSSLELPVEYNDVADTVQEEIDGKTYVLEENVLGITHVGLIFQELGAKAMMELGGLRAEANVGHGKRIYGEMVMKAAKPYLASATLHGTWVGRDEYELVITYYETPFTIKCLYKFDGDKIIITFNYNVAVGGNKTFVAKGRVKG